MTRAAHIAINKRLGLDARKLEAMTDEAYESERDFQTEKYLRIHRK
jgi:hypothetical protein